MNSEDLILPYDAFIRSIKTNKRVSHSLFLGAGASISSGIQSANDCIWDWKKEIFLSQNPNSSNFYKNIKSESVRQSIQKWIDNEGLYPQLGSCSEYSYYAQKTFPISEDRRKYFQSLIEGKHPNIGYKLLCLLNKQEIVRAVWTTNFDGLTIKAAHQADITPIEITLDTTDRIYRTQDRNELLYIALHGDYKHGDLKNTIQEIDCQDKILKQQFINYHTDKNLIVIGFSGKDTAVMNTLSETFSQKGSGRLYWCGYGHEINDSIRELIFKARACGRTAYYIPTDGFDKIMIHLTKSCFENDILVLEQMNAILSTYKEEDKKVPQFTITKTKTDKYLISNLFPIQFPVDMFQFEIKYAEGEKPWRVIKDLTSDLNISAVPFKKKVYALATLPTIKKVFSSRLNSNILRVSISKIDIGNVTAFKSLVLEAVLKNLALNKNIRSNLKDKIWLNEPFEILDTLDNKIKVHKAAYLSLFFDKQEKYAYLTINPSFHIDGEKELFLDTKKIIMKNHMEKLFNDKYGELIEFWKNYLFMGKKMRFEYPNNSGTGFEFIISSTTANAEIMVLNPKYQAYHPKEYDKRLTLYNGVQYLEPQLTFVNKYTVNPSKDFHPMRGLVLHRPYDVLLNGMVHSSDINIGIICNAKYSTRFYSFLSGLNQTFNANVNTDYLMNYPSFSSIYKLPINIPCVGDERWSDISFTPIEDNIYESAIQLARLINSKLEQLINREGKLIISIFIPNEWKKYCHYEYNGEDFDLHDYIKAFAASKGISTQLIEEDTLIDSLKCQIYWWLSLSFYVKSLRTPWVLDCSNNSTAYAGIGYSIKKSGYNSEIVIGCSHIYNSQGQGLKYKLSKVDNPYIDKQSNPFLSYEDAFQFGISIRELFYSSMEKMPQRVVIHKRTPFKKDEIKGITESLRMAGIENIDLIEINYEADVRFLSTIVYQGKLLTNRFPISRGTCIITDNTTALLWTHGIVPSVKNENRTYYLGGRSIPSPLKITKHYGDSNINIIATEILGLTKMNWNSFDLYTKLPATISSSNQIARIGKLLSRFEGRTYDYRFFI